MMKPVKLRYLQDMGHFMDYMIMKKHERARSRMVQPKSGSNPGAARGAAFCTSYPAFPAAAEKLLLPICSGP